MITVSFVASLFLNICVAIGAISVLYWINDRQVHPFITAHKKGVIQVAGFGYIAMLYLMQDLQYRVDPGMSVFGYHWSFLNMMLLGLFLIVIEAGAWWQVGLWIACAGAYVLWYASALHPLLIGAFLIWAGLLCGLQYFGPRLKQRRVWFYPPLLLFGLAGIAVIYGTRERPIDAWFLVRQITALMLMGALVGETSRLMLANDRKTATLTRMAAYDAWHNADVYLHDQEALSQQLFAAQDAARPMAVAAIDVDHYGEFNHRFGHMAGNATLVQLVRRIEDVLAGSPKQAHLYRSGGEEFTVVLQDCTIAEAEVVIAKCMAAVRQPRFIVDQHPVAVTVSAGITAIRPADKTIDAVYKRADDSLFQSKKNGRDSLSLEQTTVATHSQLAEAKLSYFVQPIQRVVAAVQPYAQELLLRQYDELSTRWQIPNRFDVSVEKQIAMISQVLAHSSVRRVTINLTLSQFSDSATANALAGFVRADYGPEQLSVEITTVPDLSTMRRVTALYRDAGIRVLIDDVGSDNSYELVEKLLPYVDGVKFAIQNLRKQESLDRIQSRVAFWTHVAAENNIGFILEGVEEASDIAFAQALGVEYFQGYYFAKPALPAV